ncbi:hypothetical protein [Nonomuraea rubra]
MAAATAVRAVVVAPSIAASTVARASKPRRRETGGGARDAASS